MAKPSPFADHCAELLAPLGPVRTRRMFSGHGFYVDDLFVALIFEDRLFLKTDEQTRPAFEKEGCEPFVYHKGDGEAVTVSYWSAPEEAMESPHAMRPWARLAMEAALRKRNAKPAPRKKKAVSPAPAAAAAKKKRATPATRR
jgi:DNA transformation protein and related proteins